MSDGLTTPAQLPGADPQHAAGQPAGADPRVGAGPVGRRPPVGPVR